MSTDNTTNLILIFFFFLPNTPSGIRSHILWIHLLQSLHSIISLSQILFSDLFQGILQLQKSIKGTVMQTEKALINDRLSVLKHFNSFYCLFLFVNKSLPLNNFKTRTDINAKFQCLLSVLKRSHICYYIICMTVPLILTVLIAVCNIL